MQFLQPAGGEAPGAPPGSGLACTPPRRGALCPLLSVVSLHSAAAGQPFPGRGWCCCPPALPTPGGHCMVTLPCPFFTSSA